MQLLFGKPEKPPHLSLRVATVALSAVAILAVELTMAEAGAWPVWSWLKACALTLACVGVTSFLRRRAALMTQGVAMTALVAAALLPLMIQAFFSLLRGASQPLDIVLLSSCRNLVLTLAVLASWRECIRLTGVLGFFLVLVSSARLDSRAAVSIISVYTAMGCVWLVLLYWNEDANCVNGGASFPISAAAMIAVILGGTAIAASFNSKQIAYALNGFLPSSGGTQAGRALARSGVGDGPDEISGGKNPKTIGYDNSDVFVNSDQCSLYDSFVETYGEPVKSTAFKKMIYLRRSDLELSSNTVVQDLRAGNSFSLLRRVPDPSAANGHGADALLFIKGRTPLHLRLTAYDRFDGFTWIESPAGQYGCTIEKAPDSTWMSLGMPTRAAIFAGDQVHQIRIANLVSDRLPTPACLTKFRMGRVYKPDFFGWAETGILKLGWRAAPPGTVIETVSRTVDPTLLGNLHFQLSPAVMEGICPAALALARQWVERIPPGWGQVQAVVQGLQRQCTLDRNERNLPADGGVMSDFLLHTRRGPDYLFASSATLLLRALGYPTRLVAGFYANPNSYDRSNDLTPITRGDVHFWTEVRLPDGTWITVEPTPGYQLEGPSISWLHCVCGATWNWVRDRAIGLGVLAIGLLMLFKFRLEAADIILTLAWYGRAKRSTRARLVETLRLIDRRIGLSGRVRPAGCTPKRWFHAQAAVVPLSCRGDLFRLAGLANWAAYAPRSSTDWLWNESELLALCHRLAWKVTVRHLRGAKHFQAGETNR